ncbi:MAG: glycosyltransferase [Leptolyngbya sp.]|nr:glycosyltransferase [Leptolyngbya sp.]
MISIVLPCLNELRHGYLPAILANLQAQAGAKEIIAVVSPSQDDTLAVLQATPGLQVIDSHAQNRAQRLSVGIAASRGEAVLLHHPATLLPDRVALEQIEAAITDPQIHWGGFHHGFDWNHWLLRFTSWYSNQVRSRYGQVLYLDHCIFARRSTLTAIGAVPDMDIFEDTALSERLQPYGPPVLLPGCVTTSARRFRSRGVYRQAWLNQQLKLMYHLGASPAMMNRLYERQAQINVTYQALKGD